MTLRPHQVGAVAVHWSTRLSGLAFCALALGEAFYPQPCFAQRFPLLTAFDTSPPSSVILGPGRGAWSGYGLASGDIDGDGTTDIVIASPFWDNPNGGQGEFDIVWGAALPDSSVLNLALPGRVSRIIGPNDRPNSLSIACGDINGDGKDDILIGEPFSDSFRGRCYIVPGSSSFPDSVNLASSAYPVVTVLSPGEDSAFGIAVCAGGDIDGDGYKDAILSAYGFDEVFVVRGSSTLPLRIDTSVESEHVVRIYDDLHPGQGLGERLACRDVDGDGYDDILFGCPGNAFSAFAGMAILLYGAPNLPALISLGSTNLRTVTIINAGAPDFLGSGVAIADFDGNGRFDLVVGADGVDGPAGRQTGAVYVIYDAVRLPSQVRVDSPDIPITVIMGSARETWWGIFGVLGTDFDRDGYDDVTVRCTSVGSQPETRDTVAVFYGRPSRPDTIWAGSDLESSKFASQYYSEFMGRGVVTTDLNGDGAADLALSAYAYASYRGRVILVYGTPTSKPKKAPPRVVALGAAPNPFSAGTHMKVSLPSAGRATLAIYDVRGRRVAVLLDQQVGVEGLTVHWDGSNDHGVSVAQGVYFARLETPFGRASHKLILVR